MARQYVELDPDMYCVTICSSFRTDHFSPMQLETFFRKCIMVYSLQIILTSFFYWQMKQSEKILRPEFELQCVRLMCSFLMHLLIHPELRQALSIMKFLK